ncbi:MAG: CopD family protein [Formosimonas sp.]|jgi:putative membrane protein
MLYLWLKILHIVFVASWFAGLFYLPRLFVNLAQVTDVPTTQRLLLMSSKLYRFMTILALPVIVLGSVMWYMAGFTGAWMHMKLTLVLILLGYHYYCGRLLKSFYAGQNRHSHVWYRWFNEIPVVFFLIITALVVIKPFSG